jgi:ribosomal protein S18 acetylase RimI-like enzyme
MTAPVMTLAAADLPPAPPVVGAYRPLHPDDLPRLEASLRGAHLAFGGGADDPGALDWLPGMRRGLREGRTLGGAVDVGGGPVAGAVLMTGGDAGELAGVWTHPDHRQRGLARQACHALLTSRLRRGAAAGLAVGGRGGAAALRDAGLRAGGNAGEPRGALSRCER